jgi:hypothetical protein
VTRIMVTLREGLCAFMIVSYSNLLRIGNILDECRRENIMMFNNIFQEIMPFKRERGKVWY